MTPFFIKIAALAGSAGLLFEALLQIKEEHREWAAVGLGVVAALATIFTDGSIKF